MIEVKHFFMTGNEEQQKNFLTYLKLGLKF